VPSPEADARTVADACADERVDTERLAVEQTSSPPDECLDVESDAGADNRDSSALGLSVGDPQGPFTGYASKHYPDPRTAPPSNVRDAVLDIVMTDGPLSKAVGLSTLP
jgi:hypothetical protein